jgi:hypothetical protein
MAEPAGDERMFPLVWRLFSVPARWRNFARWVEFLAVLILWFGLMLLLHVATRGIESGYIWHFRYFAGLWGTMLLTRAYFPEQRGEIKQEEMSGLTEPSFLGFIFPVPDKWQALVLRVEFGLVIALFVAGAAVALNWVLSPGVDLLGLIFWLILLGLIIKIIVEMYLPGLREWKLGSHSPERRKE